MNTGRNAAFPKNLCFFCKDLTCKRLIYLIPKLVVGVNDGVNVLQVVAFVEKPKFYGRLSHRLGACEPGNQTMPVDLGLFYFPNLAQIKTQPRRDSFSENKIRKNAVFSAELKKRQEIEIKPTGAKTLYYQKHWERCDIGKTF